MHVVKYIKNGLTWQNALKSDFVIKNFGNQDYLKASYAFHTGTSSLKQGCRTAILPAPFTLSQYRRRSCAYFAVVLNKINERN